MPLLPTDYMCPANWGLPILIIGITLLIINYRTTPLKGADRVNKLNYVSIVCKFVRIINSTRMALNLLLKAMKSQY